jgi:hypothetical protein
MTPPQLLVSGAYGTMSPIFCSLSRGEGPPLMRRPSADAVAGNGAPLNWRPSADAVAGNGRPLSWAPSAHAVAGRGS